MDKKRKTKNEKRFSLPASRLPLPDFLSLGVLAAAVLIFFWPVLIGGQWIPRGGGDMAAFLFPMYRFAAHSLWDGQLPLWNPTLYAGAPFLADNQSGLFYPFNLLLFLVNPNFSYRAFQLLVIFHFFFAGTGMYVCLRGLRRERPFSRPAAVLAGLIFMFNGVFITHVGNYNLNAVLAWLPLAFLGLHRAILAEVWRERLAWGIGGGLAVGIGALAGHGQSTFLVAFFLGVYALWQTAVGRQKHALPLLALVGLVGIGTAALALFPAAANIRHTLRGSFDFSQAANYSLPWEGLVGLAAPDFFGRGIARFWGNWDRVEYGYVGVLPWLLAFVALFDRCRERVSRITFHVSRFTLPAPRSPLHNLRLMLAFAVLFFTLLALGENTPLFTAVFGWWPVLPFQVPARFIFLADFGLAILAAMGLDGVMGSGGAGERGSGRVLVGWLLVGLLVGWGLWRVRGHWGAVRPDKAAQMGTAVRTFWVLAVGGWVLLWLRRRGWLGTAVFAVLVIGWVGLDLIGLGREVELEPNSPMTGYPLDSPAFRFLQEDAGLHRVEIATDAWQPSLPQLVGMQTSGGVFNPLQLAHYTAYIGSIGPRGGPLHNLLGIKYVVAGKGDPPGDTHFIVPVLDDDPNVTVYLNTRALPRVQVLYQAISVSDGDAAFTAVHEPDFDPSNTVIVENGRPLTQSPGQHTLQILRYDLNEAAFAVTNDKPAYLVLSDMVHPDWRAWDNGRAVPIVTADYALRAVYLAPGRHEVVFRYRPSGWGLGLVVSGLTWGLVGLYFGWFVRWREIRPLQIRQQIP